MPTHLLQHRDVDKELETIPTHYRKKIKQKIEQLAQDPRPPHCLKLGENLFRIRIGEYRVVYVVSDANKTATLLRVARRSEKTYRDIP